MCLNKNIIIVLVLLTGLISCSKTYKINSAKYEKVTLPQLLKNKIKYSRKIKNKQKFIITLKKGDKIPLSMKLDSKLFKMNIIDSLIASQDMCLIITDKDLSFSKNCITFASIRHLKDISKLFKIKKLDVSAGMTMLKDGLKVYGVVKAK
jgi:hypothetical protein